MSTGTVLLVAVLALSGVAASVFWGFRLVETSRQEWHDRGRQEALEHSTALDSPLLQIEAQLRALATLFHSSQHVDARELAQAEANLPSGGLSVTLTGLAYAAILDASERQDYEERGGKRLSYPGRPDRPAPPAASHFPIWLSSNGHPQFHHGADLAAIDALRSMALSAARLPGAVVMSPAFPLAGYRLIGFATSAPNGQETGLLVGFIDLQEVFERTIRWKPPGLEMRLLQFPGSWERDRSVEIVRGADTVPAASVATFDHRFTHGEARWNLQWSLMPDYDGGVDMVPAWLIGVGGSILSLLVGLALSLLICQNALIRRRVDERTAELRDALGRAEAGNRAKTNFLAVIGHELRTPLNAVIGFADLLEDKQPTPTARSYIRFVQDGGRHLLRLVNALLEVAQAEAGGLSLEEAEVEIAALIDEAVRAVDPEVTAPNVSLTLDLDDSLPRVWGDRERLLLIVVNLLFNAIRAAGSQGRVTVRAERNPTDAGLRISVADSGPGMTEMQVTASLRLFEQIEGPMNRRHEGLGIGLPLCRHLVHLHGGTLIIDTRPGEGTTVTVDLPAERSLTDLAPPVRSRAP